MCIVLPPAPPVATPAPPPPSPPTPPPAPAPAQPPTPTPAFVIDMAESKVIAPNGLNATFNAILANGGFEASVGSGSVGTLQVRTVIQNTSTVDQQCTLVISPEYEEMVVSPSRSQTFTIPGGANVTVTTLLTVSNGGGGTYNVEVTVGTTTITLPIALSFLNP